MNVLERYILRRMLVFVAGATAASLGIVWTVEALAKINVVTDTGQSIGTFLKIALFVLPTVVPIVLPFSVLIGITLTLSAMNTDSELPVIAATGAPRSVIFRPTLILACLAAVLMFMVNNVAEPYSRQIVRGMVASANSDLITLAVQEGTFKRVDQDVYVQVAKRLPNGELGGIFVSDSRDPLLDLIYYAKSGIIEKGEKSSLLLMSNGEVHRRNTKSGDLSIIRFTSYAFDLSAFMPTTGGVFLFPLDQTTDYLLNPDPKDAIFVKSPQRYQAELHKRFTQWMYPIVFALIGLVVAGSARSHRDVHLSPTMVAVGLAFAVRWLGLTFEDLASKNASYIPGIYFGLIASTSFALWLLVKQRKLRASSRRFAGVNALWLIWRIATEELVNRLSGKPGRAST